MATDSKTTGLSVDAAREMRARLRDAHFTTYNTLNTIITGGLLAYLLRRLIETPADQRPWLLLAASLLVIIACWSGLSRLLALLRFASRMSDALLSFGCGAAAYVMVSQLDEGPQAWLRAAAAVALFGGVGTLNMLKGARSDPHNDSILPLIDRDMRRAAWARLAIAPAMLGLSLSALPALALACVAVVGSAFALIVDEVVWTRAIAHAKRPAAPPAASQPRV